MCRNLKLGPFAGPIFAIILIVQCYFFALLEWLIPRSQLDYVEDDWKAEHFVEGGPCSLPNFSAADHNALDNYEDDCSRNAAHASRVAAATLSLTLPKLSRAGLTSSEKTGDPSGVGGAE